MAALGVAAAVQRGYFRGPAGYLRSNRDRRSSRSGRAAEQSVVNPTIDYALPQPTREHHPPAGRPRCCRAVLVVAPIQQLVVECGELPGQSNVLDAGDQCHLSCCGRFPAPGTAVSAGAGSFPSSSIGLAARKRGNSFDGRPPP